MAGWYIRRGEKVVGPVDTAKLKELAAAGRLLPTDHLAKDAAGPWTQAARTNLFASAPATNMAVSAPPKPPVKRPVAVPVTLDAGTTLLPQQQPQAQATAAPARSKFAFISSAGGAVSRSLAERSKRKHELALAKIQAQALTDSQRAIPVQSPPPQYYQPPPPPQQRVNVNVVQQVNFVGANRKRWSRLVAMVLSLMIPGLGQLYKGQPINGLAWFLLTGAGYFFFIIPGIVLHCLCVLGAATGDTYR